jgi:steroid delta-isomerase-like uncharacterized protein
MVVANQDRSSRALAAPTLAATWLLLGVAVSGPPPRASDVSASSISSNRPGGDTVTQTPVNMEDIRRWADAWNSHDIDTVLKLFDPAVVIHQPSNPQPLDYASARQFFSMIFRTYPDFHVTVKEAVIQGLTAVSIEQVTGTWLGPFTDPATGKTTPGNGRRFDHPGVMLIKYGADHRIRSVDIYWDRLLVNQQLGVSG